MPTTDPVLSEAEAQSLTAQAGKVFTPRSPVSTQELFAGRWDQIQRVIDAVAETGLHIVIYGERGVGKTSLANIVAPLLEMLDEKAREADPSYPHRLVVKVNAHSADSFSLLWRKAFDEVRWVENKPTTGFFGPSAKQQTSLREAFHLSDELSIDDVRRTLSVLSDSVFVFDEFDRIPKQWASSFTDLIKSLQDYSIKSTVMLVGVAETVDGLVSDHASIPRALVQIQMPRMTQKERLDILARAETKLGVKFNADASERIAIISQGLPHYVHLLGLNAVRAACSAKTRHVSMEHVKQGCTKATKDADHTLSKTYTDAKNSAHKSALFEHVLVACAVAVAQLGERDGFFQAADVAEPLGEILEKEVDVSMFNSHLQEFTKPERGEVLERSGKERAYRYRFRNPMMLPYVLLRGIEGQLIKPSTSIAQRSA